MASFLLYSRQLELATYETLSEAKPQLALVSYTVYFA